MSYNEHDALYAVSKIYPKAKHAKKINKGYSHYIFEVETGSYPEKVIVKFANNSPPKFCLGKEIRVHDILQKLGIPVPRVIFHCNDKKIFPYEFVILSKADGFDVSDIWNKISKKEQEQIAEKMGEILGKIHTMTFEKYGYLLPEGIDSKKDFSLKKVGEGFDELKSSLDIVSDGFSDLGSIAAIKQFDEKLIIEIVSFLIKNTPLVESKEKPTLIHGDFEARNIKVKKIKGEWIITSILDFEFAAASIREYDFIKLHRFKFLEENHIRRGLLHGYTKYQTINKNFDQKVEYVRLTRDIAYLFFLLKAGDKIQVEKVKANIKKVLQASETTKKEI